jgi:hypothetical protein
VELAAIGLEDRLLARLDDVILDLGLRLIVGVLDPCRVNPAVLDQLLERELRHLAPDPVEGREDDGLRRVVDDEIDAGEVLEGADIAALAADDAALHVVRGQLDHGHRCLGGVARRHPLERVGNEIAGASLRLGSRLLLQLADAPRELMPDQILGSLEQVELRLVDGHPGNALELGELLATGGFLLLLQLLQVSLPVGEPLLATGELGELSVDLLLLHEQAFLDLHDAGSVFGDLVVDLGPELDGLLPCRDLRFTAQSVGLALGLAPEGVRFAFRVVQQELALLPRCTEAGLSERAYGKGAHQTSDYQPDQYPDSDHHEQLQGSLARWLPRPTRRSGRHGMSRISAASRHLGSEAVG